jgi:hypothetical protein
MDKNRMIIIGGFQPHPELTNGKLKFIHGFNSPEPRLDPIVCTGTKIV